MHITTQRRLGNSGRTVLTIIAIRTSAGSTTTPGMEYIGRHTATTVAIESSPFYSQREFWNGERERARGIVKQTRNPHVK